MAEGGLSGWVTEQVSRWGEVGVGLLIALENLFPPIPSEVVLPFAGFQVERGELTFALAWLAATLGALAGALILYGLGAGVGYERLHDLAGKRWFVVLGQRDLERGERFFERYGTRIVLFGRCVPLVRSVVSVPAGLARMPLGRFCVLTTLGSAAWNLAFLGLGVALGQRWDRVDDYVGPVGYAVAAVLVLWVTVLTVRKVRRVRRSRPAA